MEGKLFLKLTSKEFHGSLYTIFTSVTNNLIYRLCTFLHKRAISMENLLRMFSKLHDHNNFPVECLAMCTLRVQCV